MDDDKTEGGAPATGTEKDPSEPLSSAAGANIAEEKDDPAEPLASLFEASAMPGPSRVQKAVTGTQEAQRVRPRRRMASGSAPRAE